MKNSLIPVYAIMGSRLSMQLISPYGYGQLGGRAGLQFAHGDFLRMSGSVPYGFGFEQKPTSNIDFFNGPNLAVGLIDEVSNEFRPHIAFIYRPLDIDGEAFANDVFHAYQAQILFDEDSLVDAHEETCYLLKHAATLVLQNANSHSITHPKPMPIILGIDQQITEEFPNIGKSIARTGFVSDNRYVEDHHIHLFHKNTSWNPNSTLT